MKLRRGMAILLAAIMTVSSVQMGSISVYAAAEGEVAAETDNTVSAEESAEQSSEESEESSEAEDITEDAAEEIIVSTDPGVTEEAESFNAEELNDEVPDTSLSADANITETEEETVELLEEATTGTIYGGGTFTLDGTKLTVDGKSAGNGELYIDYMEYDENAQYPDKRITQYDKSKITSLTIKNYNSIRSELRGLDGWDALTSITLSEGLEVIGAYSLRDRNITSISIPSTVTEIGYSAFSETKLRSVSVPSTVKTIGMGAFEGCTDLETVTLKDGLETIGSNVFSDCPKLKELIIPDSVTKVGSLGIDWDTYEADDGTKYDNSLKTLSFPISANYTGPIEVPYSVTKVIFTKGNGGDWWSVSNLNEHLVKSTSKTESEYEVVFEEGITSIPDYCCYQGNGSLTKVTIPSTVTYIGDDAFEYSEELKEVVFTEGSGTRSLHIGNQAFASGAYTAIDFPKDINSFTFGHQVFFYSKLKNVYFRNTQAVIDCSSIKGEQVFCEGTVLQGSDYEYSTGKVYSIKKYVENYSGYGYTFKKLGAAPKPVEVKGISLLQSMKVLYSDAVNDGDTVEFTAVITPANADNVTLSIDKRTVIPTGSESIISDIKFGSINRTTGECPVRVVLNGKKGGETFTIKVVGEPYDITGGVVVKDRDKAVTPYTKVISGTGSDYGDKIALFSQTSNAQIFYLIDNKADNLSLNSAIEWNAEKGRFVSKSPDIIREYSDPIIIGEDITAIDHMIHAVAVKEGFSMSEIMDAELSYPDSDYKWGTITPEDRKGEFNNNIDKFLSSNEYQGIWAPESQCSDVKNIHYTGNAITIPNLRVYYGNTLLNPKTDYTLKYLNNVNVGAFAEIKVTLKGNYSGTGTIFFTIYRSTLTEDDITWTVQQVNAKKDSKGAWKQQTPDPKLYVKATGKVLKKGTDYDIRYSLSGTDAYSDHIDAPGIYDIEISDPKGDSLLNYVIKGKVLNIKNAVYCIGGENVAMSKVTVTKIASQDINSDQWKDKEAVEPSVEVKYKGKTLIQGADSHYTVTYENNSSVGTATVIIKGTNKDIDADGDGDPDGISFNGIKKVTFKITGTVLNKNNTSIEGVNDEYPYTGSAIVPSYKVLYDGKELIEDTDYTVVYSKGGNVKTGKVTVTFKGKGRYSGSVADTYKIGQIDVTQDDSLLIKGFDGSTWEDKNESFDYVKNGVKPKFTVTVKGNELKAGTDYTVTYANNKAIGDYNAEKKGKKIGPSFTIKCKGNYKGTVTRYFSVKKENISGLNMSLNDLVVSKSANKYTQKVVITDDNGSVLKAGTDYDKTLKYTYDADTVITYKSGKKLLSDVRNTNDEVKKTDIIPAGTVIRVTAEGIGNYEGKLSDTFCIAAGKIGSLKFSMNDDKTSYVYTGSLITPGKSDIKVKIKDGKRWKDLEDASYYYDIIGYKNNLKKGTATITIRGKNGYAGTATIKFKIVGKTYSKTT